MGALGLLAGLGTPLAAQTLWVPASDPVGIARGGAGVAFGQSLEAAALNPALLVTLREDASAFLAAGMELQSSQATLQANSSVQYSTDRNRFLPALGAAWKLKPNLYLGLKFDNPFMRHAELPSVYTGRFEAQGMDLTTRRAEIQLSYALTPGLSFGASLGMTHVKYSFTNSVRVEVPGNPLAPVGTANPVQGLLELNALQEGSKNLPSYALGFRWAMNPRWTIAGAYQGSITGTLPVKARLDDSHRALVGKSGFGDPNAIAVPAAQTLQGILTVTPGSGDITLPGRFTLGVRQRMTQTFTWEADLRYVLGGSLKLPGYATVTGPTGTVSGSGFPGEVHSGFGISLAGEVTFTKNLTGRLGLSSDPGLRKDPTVEPVLGGSRTAAFSAGLGWKVLKGEVNLGWQIRQSQDREVKNLDFRWGTGGVPTTTGTLTRVEGMGHLWSIGYKKAF
ncbi:OmpP1/FadL family transporter [Mesoterricola silvestris]|uniref:OmpP1/FadL family transporter n=1 Tax=Mesoterricola silvestris TaxID=2927979 RepID=UPI0029316706|nr:outer membrane protein transport protein [Mesoterricola silvestris]